MKKTSEVVVSYPKLSFEHTLNEQYTFDELEKVQSTVLSAGWTVIEKHLNSHIQIYTEQLVNSSDTEDEKLKGRILAIMQDVLTIPKTFDSMLKESIRQEEVNKK